MECHVKDLILSWTYRCSQLFLIKIQRGWPLPSHQNDKAAEIPARTWKYNMASSELFWRRWLEGVWAQEWEWHAHTDQWECVPALSRDSLSLTVHPNCVVPPPSLAYGITEAGIKMSGLVLVIHRHSHPEPLGANCSFMLTPVITCHSCKSGLSDL